MDFITGLLILEDWNRDNYNLILINVDWFIKMIYSRLVKVTTDTLSLAKIIIDVIVRHYGFPSLIITHKGAFFTSKFYAIFLTL